MIELYWGGEAQAFSTSKKTSGWGRKPSFWTESREITENFGLITVLKILQITVSIKLFHGALPPLVFILTMDKRRLALNSVYRKGTLLTPAG